MNRITPLCLLALAALAGGCRTPAPAPRGAEAPRPVARPQPGEAPRPAAAVEPARDTLRPPSAQTAVPPPRRPHTIDDEFADLARVVPGGFGGYWLEGNRLHAYLTDVSQGARARAVLAERLRGRFGPGADGQRGMVKLDSTVFHPARYDFLQLRRWYLRLVRAVDDPGVMSTDITENENRLTVAVRGDAAAARVRRQLGATGIPARAVHVRVVNPVNEF